jgi:hypothetical protein
MPFFGKCKKCGKTTSWICPSDKKSFCSRRCVGLAHGTKKGSRLTEETKAKISFLKTGSGNSNWRGGRTERYGYVRIWAPEHPFKNQRGYVLEHRLVMEKHLGRFLKKGEVVHHINGIRNDNRIENLQLFPSNYAHAKHHRSVVAD